MLYKRFSPARILFFCLIGFTLTSVSEAATTVKQSVTQALSYSPRLKALTFNNEALEYDLRKARGAYFPSVDLYLGYGREQYSDRVTRQVGAIPNDTDWDPKGAGTLKITQKVYDGGETGHQVSIQKALLESSQFRIMDATQSVILEAITTHLDVYKQRELIALAENNLGIHKEIYQLLEEGEQAGFVSIADVSQIKARLARAESTLFNSNADYDRAVANYKRLVGAIPKELTYAPSPESMARSLEEALIWMEEKNPELSALEAELNEADAKVALTRSGYKPKVNIELSSQYNDQIEGDSSWKNSNEAMLVMHWNLFNGGQDKAKHSAELSRKSRLQSHRNDRLFELRETTSSVWADYISRQNQRHKYREAVDFSKETFDAYLNQFNVGKRDLLDVLSAENDYFQSASQLIIVSVEEKIAAYHLLRLWGVLEPSSIPDKPEDSGDIERLSERLVLQSTDSIDRIESQADSSTAAKHSPRPETGTEESAVGAMTSELSDYEKMSPMYSIEIGPFINTVILNQASEIIKKYGLQTYHVTGSGPVKFTRLFEGIYPTDEAHQRLAVLKKTVDSAFVLPKGKNLEVYAGSFRDSAKAERFSETLALEGIRVTPVLCEIEQQGTILIVEQVDDKTTLEITRQMLLFEVSVKKKTL